MDTLVTNIPFYRKDEHFRSQESNAQLELLITESKELTKDLILEKSKETKDLFLEMKNELSEIRKRRTDDMTKIIEYVAEKNRKVKMRVKQLERRLKKKDEEDKLKIQEAKNRLDILEERLDIQSPLRQNSLRIEQRKDKENRKNCYPRIRSLGGRQSVNKLRSQTTESNYSSRDLSGSKSNRRVDPIVLTEVQLQALKKGNNCVKFIGDLLFSSFPEGYFLESNNSFARAVSSENMVAFFEIVSNEYTEIKRPRHPLKPLTMKDMYEVMRNKVVSYRTNNRRFQK